MSSYEEDEYDPVSNFQCSSPEVLLVQPRRFNASAQNQKRNYQNKTNKQNNNKSHLIQSIELESLNNKTVFTNPEMQIQVQLTNLHEKQYVSTQYWNISKQYLLYLFYLKWCFQVLLHKMLLDEYAHYKTDDIQFQIIYVSKSKEEQNQKTIYDFLHAETIHYFSDYLVFFANFSDFLNYTDDSVADSLNTRINIHFFIFEDMNLLSNYFQSEDTLNYLFESYFFYFTSKKPCTKHFILGSTWNTSALLSKIMMNHNTKLNQNHLSSLLNDFYFPFYFTHLFCTNPNYDFSSFGLFYFRNEKIPILMQNKEKNDESVCTLLTKEYFVIPKTFKQYAAKFGYECIQFTSWQEWFYINYILEENNIYHHWLTEIKSTNGSASISDVSINNVDPDTWNELSLQNVFVLEKYF
jgi:hypothetical protein